MKLTHYGDFAFACVTKKGTFVLNPGKNDDSLLCSIFTKPDRDMTLQGNMLSWPGEYEYGGVAMQLFQLGNGALGAKVFTEAVRMLFLPALEKELSEEEMQVFGNVDVLVIEVPEMNAACKKMVEEIDPRAILPVGKAQEKFLAEMGAGQVESVETFDCTSGSLPADQTMFVKLMAA